MRKMPFTRILILTCLMLWGCATQSPEEQFAAQTPPPAATPSLPPASPDITLTESLSLPLVVNSPTSTAAPASTATPTTAPEQPVRFAVIGDFGLAEDPEADVAALVLSWQPDFIITTGDNNYPDGEAATMDENIGQYYHDYIFPYTGGYGAGADQNRFFPVPGNHDWNTPGLHPYIDYFALPGNERYYDFTWGPLHFFALDSDSREPDGVGASSAQAAWLQQTMAASTAQWQIVYMHHPPYSSGLHGPVDWTRWPYQEWGADAVLSGHDHTYERLDVDGLAYFVNGLGGGPIYYFNDPLPGSQVRYNEDYGAMLVEATRQEIVFMFFNRSGDMIDRFAMAASP